MNRFKGSIANRAMRRVDGLREGEYPISSLQGAKYLQACRRVGVIIDTTQAAYADIEDISEVKGFYGKSYDREKSDAIDWRSVWILMGQPEKSLSHRAREVLYGLLRCITHGDGNVHKYMVQDPNNRFLFHMIRGMLARAEQALVDKGYDCWEA